MRNPVQAVVWWVGRALSRLGLIDGRKAERTTDLAWPRIVTGLARLSQSAADIAMVGAALGPAAIAGIGFASPFWYLAITIGGGIAGGTISLVSQRFGAEQYDELDLVVKQGVWLAVLLGTPFVLAFWFLPTELVGLLGSDTASIEFGSAYLQLLGLGVVFGSLNLVASRTLVGADDAWTPMVVRAGGAIVNIGINAVLIFGFGLGVAGAAAGTVLANALVTGCFAWGFLGGGLPGVGQFPVTISASGPYVDSGLARDLAEIATPLVLNGMAGTVAQFPLLWIVGLFGPEVVAAFVIARRVRGLMDTPGWGFGLASSSLVGQELGTGDELEAEAYGWDILQFALAVYVVLAAGVFVFAEPIGRVFVQDPSILPLVTVFVQVATVSVVWNGINGAATGPLRASGDTRWLLYGRMLGLYAFTLPIAYVGAVTSIGVTALYLALVVETMVPALVSLYRFNTGKWKIISRSYRPSAA